MATRPNLSTPSSLTGRQWQTIRAIEAKGHWKLVEVAEIDRLREALREIANNPNVARDLARAALATPSANDRDGE